MTIQQNMKKKSIAKLALSSLSLSALLALSACSGGDNKAEEPAAVNETETVVVEPEAPAAETEVVTPEPAVEAEPTEVPVVEAETEAAAEPELLGEYHF